MKIQNLSYINGEYNISDGCAVPHIHQDRSYFNIKIGTVGHGAWEARVQLSKVRFGSPGMFTYNCIKKLTGDTYFLVDVYRMNKLTGEYELIVDKRGNIVCSIEENYSQVHRKDILLSIDVLPELGNDVQVNLCHRGYGKGKIVARGYYLDNPIPYIESEDCEFKKRPDAYNVYIVLIPNDTEILLTGNDKTIKITNTNGYINIRE